jgi:hypothetical protein
MTSTLSTPVPSSYDLDSVVEELYWEREREYLNASLALVGGYVNPRFAFVGGTNVIGLVERSWPILSVYLPQMELTLSRLPLSENSLVFKVFNRELSITPKNPNPVGTRLEVQDPELLPKVPGYYAEDKLYLPFGEVYYYLYDQFGREALYISQKKDTPPFAAIHYRSKLGFGGPLQYMSIFPSRKVNQK